MNPVLYCLFLIILNRSESALVRWIPNTSFNLPSSFTGNKLPCSNETVIFPEAIASAIVIDGEKSLGGIVLPEDGLILLPRDGAITFERNGESDGCPGGDAYYMENLDWWWAQPDVWMSPNINEATPDADRIPCYDDVVVFTSESGFTVRLPDVTQSVRGFSVDGQNIGTPLRLRVLINLGTFGLNDLFVFNTHGEVGIEIEDKACPTKSGCPCQDQRVEIICTKKYCKPIQCLSPIKPEGHCCNICGGSLVFDADDTFDISEFRILVDGIINENGGRQNLDYYVGKLDKRRVQLVVVEKNRYESRSAVVVSAVNTQLKSGWEVKNVARIMSGIPLSEVGLTGRTIVGVFVLVALFMIGLYLVYYKSVPLPNFSLPTARGWRSRGSGVGVMSRFQRRTESVVSLTRRESPPPHEGDTSGATAFRNPLYDSKRGFNKPMAGIQETTTADGTY